MLIHLPKDLYLHTISFLEPQMLPNLYQTVYPNNELRLLTKKKLNELDELFVKIRGDIIDIFLNDNVKCLKISGDMLIEQLSNYMTPIHSMKNYVMYKWKSDKNEIINTFMHNYIRYYIDKFKPHFNMSIDHSFVVSIVMTLYH